MSVPKPTIVFVLPNLAAPHFRNRILDFVRHGFEICVYGYERHNNRLELPYQVHSLGTVSRMRYKKRIMLYVKTLFGITRNHNDAVFYLGNLDIAMFFRLLHPFTRYIYEECDLSHTYERKLTRPLEFIDKRIIRRSMMTVTTSEGFIRYHFGARKPDNVFLIENKLNPDVVNFPARQTRRFDKSSLVIGFVGGPRFDTVHHFIETFCREFPKYKFHVFGGPVLEEFEDLKKVPNCIFHGFFTNPDDLPVIYDSIDILLCTYPVSIENVRYAEPNKLYECIYYEKPILVSKGTYLEEKVKRLGIGYSIDAMDDNEIVSFVNNLSEAQIEEMVGNARSIEKKSLIDSNEDFFDRLELEFSRCIK